VARRGAFASFDEGLIQTQSASLQEGQFLSRFVRQREFTRIESSIQRSENVNLGTFFTRDHISTSRSAVAQLSLPNVARDPIVGILRVPAPSFRGTPFGGPQLVRPNFRQIGSGTEIEFLTTPRVPSAGIELRRLS